MSRKSLVLTHARPVLLQHVCFPLYAQDGGFYSAEDADSFPKEGDKNKREGAFCVWTKEEVDRLLSKPLPKSEGKTLADLFSFHYGVETNGNVSPQQDPHGELKCQNVLIVRRSVKDAAEKFGLEEEQVRQLLAQSRAVLFQQRQKRPKPHRDDKILTAWNGKLCSLCGA